jgi:ABC-type Zn uptake system ZnuABC Zn-binding protein ZnuA
MRRPPRALLVALASLLALGPGAGGAGAAPAVRVVASLPDLKALTEAVGGDLVEVESLARGTQNPHDIEVRPSLMLKLRRADLLIRNGAGGDPWVEPLVVGAQNARIVPGAPGHVDASRGVPLIPPRGPVDRSRGDVHPEGNPHYTLDPALAELVTATIAEGLARAAPQHAAEFDARRRGFLARLATAMAGWQRALEPLRGARVVTYHETFDYFLRRFGLELAATVEDRPGIPPSPTHLAGLIRTIKEQRVRLVMAEPFADRKTVELVARDGGARAVVLPSAVGGVKGVETYLDLMDHLVRGLAQALR